MVTVMFRTFAFDHERVFNSSFFVMKTRKDRLVSHNKGFRANIIVWGMRKDLPTLEVKAKLVFRIRPLAFDHERVYIQLEMYLRVFLVML